MIDSPPISDRVAANVIIENNHVPLTIQFSANAPVRDFTTTHLSHLTMSG